MQVMQELGLIGLRIQRMPNEPGLEFGIPSQYSYMTVIVIQYFIFFARNPRYSLANSSENQSFLNCNVML